MSTFTKTFSVAIAAALIGLAGCTPPAENSAGAGNTPDANAPGANTPEPAGPALTGKIPIVIETSMGTIEAELDADKAPITVKNFVDYANKGFYDGTVFHRVISDFMIQGGGFTEELKEKPNADPIQNEASNGVSNTRGTLAMARTPDPNSATSQFFINVVDNGYRLDPSAEVGAGYAVFGKVTKGMDVVDKIKAVKTTSKPLTQLTPTGEEIQMDSPDVPEEAVIIKSIKVLEAKDGKAESGDPVDAPTDSSGGANAPAAGDTKANAPASGPQAH